MDRQSDSAAFGRALDRHITGNYGEDSVPRNVSIVEWGCTCKCRNMDDYVKTALPMCGQCGNTFEWDELLTLEEMDALNELLKGES